MSWPVAPAPDTPAVLPAACAVACGDVAGRDAAGGEAGGPAGTAGTCAQPPASAAVASSARPARIRAQCFTVDTMPQQPRCWGGVATATSSRCLVGPPGRLGRWLA